MRYEEFLATIAILIISYVAFKRMYTFFSSGYDRASLIKVSNRFCKYLLIYAVGGIILIYLEHGHNLLELNNLNLLMYFVLFVLAAGAAFPSSTNPEEDNEIALQPTAEDIGNNAAIERAKELAIIVKGQGVTKSYRDYTLVKLKEALSSDTQKTPEELELIKLYIEQGGYDAER